MAPRLTGGYRDIECLRLSEQHYLGSMDDISIIEDGVGSLGGVGRVAQLV